MIDKKKAIINMKKAGKAGAEDIRQAKNFIHKYNKLPKYESSESKTNALEKKKGIAKKGINHVYHKGETIDVPDTV